jgi:phosphate transport system ATP-binding protein
VILMDEPCSALDPISTSRIEDLMLALRERLSIVIVTHNMQQAARVSQTTAFLTVVEGHGPAEGGGGEERSGRIVEYDATEAIFTNPRDPRTEAYVSGRVG